MVLDLAVEAFLPFVADFVVALPVEAFKAPLVDFCFYKSARMRAARALGRPAGARLRGGRQPPRGARGDRQQRRLPRRATVKAQGRPVGVGHKA